VTRHGGLELFGSFGNVLWGAVHHRSLRNPKSGKKLRLERAAAVDLAPRILITMSDWNDSKEKLFLYPTVSILI